MAMTEEEAMDMIQKAFSATLQRDNPDPYGLANTPVSEQWILEALSKGQTNLSELPMDGPGQEAATLKALPKIHEGAARVNANTSGTGIRAVTDEKGHVTLTNVIGPDPMRVGGPTIQKGAEDYDTEGNAIGLPPTAPEVTVSNNVHGLLNMMRGEKDPSKVMAIHSQLNEAAAVERAKMMAETQKHAANGVGLADAENAFTHMRQAAVNQGWDPLTMPEPPMLMQMRTRIDQLKGVADKEANRLLGTNVTYKSLLAAEENAKAEAQRAIKVSDRANALIDTREGAKINMQAQDELYRRRTADARAEEIRSKISGLTAHQKEVARILNPDKATASDEELYRTIERMPTKDRAILDAPPEALPLLAVTGNSGAAKIIEAREQAAGIDPALTRARLTDLRLIMGDKRLLKEGFETLTKGSLSTDEQKGRFSEISGKAEVGSPDEKKAAMMAKYDMAKAKLQAMVSNTHRNNLNTWQVADPAFKQAVEQSVKVTKSAALPDVLTAYLGDTSGPERRQRVDQFLALAAQGAKATEASQLGAVDGNMLRHEITQMANRTYASRILASINAAGDRPIWAAVPFSPLSVITAGTEGISGSIRNKLAEEN